MFRDMFKSKRQQGFTIIEVMIVLAIAGLIMVVVLVAIPQLQRNQRNEARRNVLSRIAAEVNNYISNNAGLAPDEAATTNSFSTGFKPRYIDNAPAGTFDKPGGGAYTFDTWDAAQTVMAATAAAVQDRIEYNLGASCSGELPTGAGASATRNFAIAVGLEGGASFCVDNQ